MSSAVGERWEQGGGDNCRGRRNGRVGSQREWLWSLEKALGKGWWKRIRSEAGIICVWSGQEQRGWQGAGKEGDGKFGVRSVSCVSHSSPLFPSFYTPSGESTALHKAALGVMLKDSFSWVGWRQGWADSLSSDISNLLSFGVSNLPVVQQNFVMCSVILTQRKLCIQLQRKMVIKISGLKVRYSCCGSLIFMGEIWECFYSNLKYFELNGNHWTLWRFRQASLYLCEAWLFLPLALYYLLYKSISIAFSCCIQDTAVYHLSYSHYIFSFLWKTILSSIKDLLTKGNKNKNLRWHNAAKCFPNTCIIQFSLPLLSKLCWKISVVYVCLCVPQPIAHLTLRFPSFLLPPTASLVCTSSSYYFLCW